MIKNNEFSRECFKRKLADAGYSKNSMLFDEKESFQKKQKTILKGDLNFSQLPSGLSLHYTDLEEKIVGHNTAEITDGISINYLIFGRLNFALELNNYQFSATNKPLMFINVIKEPILFTRFFNKGQHIKKLNLSVSKNWLYERCKSEHDKQTFHALFSIKQAVYEQPLSDKTLNLVKDLIKLKKNDDIASCFHIEKIAFQLFGQCYEFLSTLDKTAITPTKDKEIIHKPNSPLYEEELEKWIYEALNLQELSVKLGASISTLQRYFKHKHHLTVQEYIRHQKLEYARRSLIFENKSIGEVAYEAGYNHVSNFIIAFKKYFLMTPSQLKSRYQQKG